MASFPYSICRSDRLHSQGGGSAIHLHSSINFLIHSSHSKASFNVIACDLLDPLSSPFLRLVCVYRSPSISTLDHHDLIDLIADLCSTRCKVVVCGDFNLPTIDWFTVSGSSLQDRSFLDLCNSAGLTQSVRFPTRSNSTLDLVLTDNPMQVGQLRCIPGLLSSDHYGVAFEYTCSETFSSPFRLVPRYSRANFAALNAFFQSIDWLALRGSCSSVSEFYERFCCIILGTMAQQIPISEAGEGYQHVPSYIVNIAKHRENLMPKRHLEPVQKELVATEKKLRTSLKKYWANKEKTFYKRANKAMLFRHIAHHLRSKKSEVMLIGVDGKPLPSDEEKARALAEHFSSVYQHGSSAHWTSDHQVEPALTFFQVTDLEVRYHLMRSTSSSTIPPDGIPAVVLKKCAGSLSVPISILLNSSLHTGEIPEVWKVSSIRPLLKCSPPIAYNFRPISITSSVARTMERCIKQRLLRFVLDQGIIPENQYGFRPAHSVTDQLLTCTDAWTEALDQKKCVDVVYFDFRKAFDVVPHDRLLQKLSSYPR